MQILGIGVKVNESKKTSNKSINNNQQMQADIGIPAENKLSTDNCKAYFLASKLSFKANYPVVIDPEEDDSSRVQLSSTLNRKKDSEITNIAGYEDIVKKIAINIAAGQKTNLVYENGTMPKFVAHTMTKMIKDGKLVTMGLNRENTDIVLINSGDALLGGHKPFEMIMSAYVNSRKAKRKLVVFVEDYHTFASTNGSNNTVNPFIFSNNFMKDLNVVFVNDARNSELNANSKLNNLKEIRLTPLSKEETKTLLKENQSIKKIIDETEKIKITDEALNAAVDITESTAGEYPGKAIDLLKQTIANKSIETHSVVKDISAEDVQNVFNLYPEMKESKKSDSGLFEVIHKTGVTLDDVGGITTIKGQIKDELLYYLNKPVLTPAEKKDIPKGVLLYGPPGTGKTLLAKAIAGEAGVPFINASASGFIEKYVGVGAQRVRELFSLARMEASKSPKKTAIVFIDEIDAIAKKRSGGSDGGNSEQSQSINQLLTEMDGLKNDNGIKIIVMAATNRKELLDDAVIRSGRLDLHFEIPNPANDRQARYEIMKIHTKNRPFKDEESKEKILQEMADVTAGMSGADIENLTKKANRLVRKRKEEKPYITMDDMKEAELQIKYGPIGKVDLPDWEVASMVGHEFGHAVVSTVVSDIYGDDAPWNKQDMEINSILLQPRGNSLGSVTFKTNDKNGDTLESLIGHIAMALGGYSDEEAQHGSHMSGVSGDLKQATALAYQAVTKHGMGPQTRLISTAGLPEGVPIEAGLNAQIINDVRFITSTAQQVSDKIIKFNKPFIEECVSKFKAGQGGEILSGEEFKARHKQWLKDNGKEAELQKLKEEIKLIITNAKDDAVQKAKLREKIKS
jgi:cell division protease FtsH